MSVQTLPKRFIWFENLGVGPIVGMLEHPENGSSPFQSEPTVHVTEVSGPALSNRYPFQHSNTNSSTSEAFWHFYAVLSARLPKFEYNASRRAISNDN